MSEAFKQYTSKVYLDTSRPGFIETGEHPVTTRFASHGGPYYDMLTLSVKGNLAVPGYTYESYTGLDNSPEIFILAPKLEGPASRNLLLYLKDHLVNTNLTPPDLLPNILVDPDSEVQFRMGPEIIFSIRREKGFVSGHSHMVEPRVHTSREHDGKYYVDQMAKVGVLEQGGMFFAIQAHFDFTKGDPYTLFDEIIASVSDDFIDEKALRDAIDVKINVGLQSAA